MEVDTLEALQASAKRVAEGKTGPGSIASAAAQFFAELPAPCRYGPVGHNGRIGFGRKNADKPGITIAIPETTLEMDLQALEARHNSFNDASFDADTQFSSLDELDLQSPDAAAFKVYSATDYPISESPVLWSDLYVVATFTAATLAHADRLEEGPETAVVRFRGPGVDGRVYFDPRLEDVPAMGVWLPTVACPDSIGEDYLEKHTGLAPRGNTSPVEEVPER